SAIASSVRPSPSSASASRLRRVWRSTCSLSKSCVYAALPAIVVRSLRQIYVVCPHCYCQMIDLCLLGTGGAMPLPERALSALLFRVNGNLSLIDCGEGTQVSMRRLGWGFRALGTIFISHF